MKLCYNFKVLFKIYYQVEGIDYCNLFWTINLTNFYLYLFLFMPYLISNFDYLFLLYFFHFGFLHQALTQSYNLSSQSYCLTCMCMYCTYSNSFFNICLILFSKRGSIKK